MWAKLTQEIGDKLGECNSDMSFGDISVNNVDSPFVLSRESSFDNLF